MGLVNRLDNFIRDCDNLEKKVFFVIVVVEGWVALASFMGTLVFGMSPLASFIMFACWLHSLLFFFLGLWLKRYDSGLMVFCIILCCVFMPFAFVFDAGLYAGMPFFLMGTLLMCALNPNHNYRVLSFCLALLVYLVLFGLAIVFPDALFRLDPAVEDTHIIISFAGVAIAMLVLTSIVLEDYAAYQHMNELIGRHTTTSIRDDLFLRVGSSEEEHIGMECNAAIAFFDLCSFTSRTENLEAPQVAEYLNLYFDLAGESIREHNGIIEQFMGDCVKAFWIDKPGEDNAALSACRAAIDIRDQVNGLADDVFDRFGCEIAVSIGIAYGKVVLGDIGSQNRKDYTVVGDVVNLAALLEDVATKGVILVDGCLKDRLAGRLKTEIFEESMRLKGREGRTSVYLLIGGERTIRNFLTSIRSTQTGYVLTICGCRGSFSVSGQRFSRFGGETSCYVLRKDDYALVIDCGSGFQRAREILAGCSKVDVFLTHVHYDHLVGLLDLTVFPPDAEITFFGCFDKWLGTSTLDDFFGLPYWPVVSKCANIVTVGHGDRLDLHSDLSIEFYESQHPDNALLALVDVAGKRICILFDCEDPSVLPESAAEDCEMILFDGMYDDAEYSSRVGWGHSTWEEGVRFACIHKPKRLVITHHDVQNSDRKLQELEAKAQEVFPNTMFARAGDRFLM